MMKLRLAIAAFLIAIMGMPLVALASDISDALFYGVIRVTNTGTEATNVVTTANISTTVLNNNGYINAAATDCVIRSPAGADLPFMPGYTPVGNPWCIWVPSIGQDALVNDLLYTADSSGGEITYFPGATGMAVVDVATIEPSDNFTFKQTGWVNTDNGSNKFLVHKANAFAGYISATVDGDITFSVGTLTSGAATVKDVTTGVHSVNVTLDDSNLFYSISIDGDTSFLDSWPIESDLVLNTPLYHTSFSDSTFISKDANGHSCTSDNPTWDVTTGRTFNGTTDYITVGSDASINLADAPLTIEAWIKGDNAAWPGGQVVFASDNASGYNLTIKPTTGLLQFLKTGVVLRAESGVGITDTNWHHVAVVYHTTDNVSFYIDGVPDGGNPYASNEASPTFDTGLTYHIGARGVDGNTQHFDGIIGEVRVYDNDLSDADVLANYNATKWRFDGLAVRHPSYGLVGTGVPGNANNWAFVQNDSMVYMDSTEIIIGGTPTALWEWQYGATFIDSVNSIVATPTFLVAPTDADVTAELLSFAPVSEAQAPAFVLSEPGAFLTPDTGNVTSQFSTDPPAGTFPLAGIISAIASATSTPPQLPLLIIATIIILVISLTYSATTRQFGSGSVWIKMVVIAGVMGIFVALGDFGIDFWMIVLFLMISTAWAMASKQLGWT